jgi:ribosomal protein S18 acetylase RimI-like enzyme
VTGPVFSLREFRFPDDYAGVFSLWKNAGPGIHVRPSDEPAEIAKKLQRDPDLFLVAEAQGGIVGAVMGGYDGRRGMVYHLAVDPDRREQGIGDALMAELEERLKAKGCIRYTLLVDPANEAAIQFYERRGWARMPMFVFGKDIA